VLLTSESGTLTVTHNALRFGIQIDTKDAVFYGGNPPTCLCRVNLVVLGKGGSSNQKWTGAVLGCLGSDGIGVRALLRDWSQANDLAIGVE